MVSAPDDARLVAEAIGGSRSAKRRLADRLLDVVTHEVTRVLWRQAASRGRDPRQEVHDLTHEVLVLFLDHDAQELRRWDSTRGRSLDSFVRLVARRRVARILGQGRGNPWADQPVDPLSMDTAPSERDDTSFVRHLEQRNQLGVVLDELYGQMGPRDAELFDLLFVQDRDAAEVAESLGMARGAINTWRYRIRKQARGLIARIIQRPTKGATGRGESTKP